MPAYPVKTAFGLLCLLLACALPAPAQTAFTNLPPITALQAQAKAGDPQAQTALAAAYLSGTQGLPQDDSLALKWLRRAASRSSSSSSAQRIQAPSGRGIGTRRARTQPRLSQ